MLMLHPDSYNYHLHQAVNGDDPVSVKESKITISTCGINPVRKSL